MNAGVPSDKFKDVVSSDIFRLRDWDFSESGGDTGPGMGKPVNGVLRGISGESLWLISRDGEIVPDTGFEINFEASSTFWALSCNNAVYSKLKVFDVDSIACSISFFRRVDFKALIAARRFSCEIFSGDFSSRDSEFSDGSEECSTIL